MSAGNTKYDVIVIGSGHNGLTTAALLAKQGRSVLVLERRESVGGLGASEEFHAGYRTAGVLHDTTGVRHSVVRSLNLDRYGLEFESAPPSIFTPQVNGKGLLLHHDADKAAGEIAAFSERDAERYAEYRRFIDRVRGVVNSVLDDVPTDIFSINGARDTMPLAKKALALRRLGKRDMTELLRVAPMSVADWLDEWFETDLIKASLALSAVQGTFAGPRSPGSALNLLIWECRKGPSIKGGAGFLVTALEGVARANGVEIQTDAAVERILLSNGRIAGVSVRGGDAFHSSIVAASCDPKQTFLELLSGRDVTESLAHQVRNFRSYGISAKVHIGMNARVEMADRPGEKVEFVRTGESLDQLERAFDAVKYGRYSDDPVLDIYVPTFSNPGFAPEGHTVLSVLVYYVPYALENSWNDREREIVGEKVVDALCRYGPALRDVVVSTDVVTPVDIETRYATAEGHLFHGDHALDQLLVRPTPGCAAYATPIDGLFLCGSGSHPGGGITCGPGSLAARAIIQGS